MFAVLKTWYSDAHEKLQSNNFQTQLYSLDLEHLYSCVTVKINDRFFIMTT
jgi:hypothetical protein